MSESTDHCVRCQYDLRGIANDQPCPECGLLAERSRGVSERLRDTDPAYLSKLALGVWVMLGSLLIPLAGFAAIVADDLLNYRLISRSFRRTIVHLPLLGITLGAAVFILGVWWTTAPDRRTTASRRGLRIAIRLMAIAMLAGLVSVHGSLELERWVRVRAYAAFTLQNAGNNSYTALDGFSDTFDWPQLVRTTLSIFQVLVLLLAVLPLPALLFWHLSGIGKRLLSRQISEHSMIVGIGLSGSILFVVAIYYLASYGERLGLPELHRKSQVPIVVLTICFTAGILFSLWTLYLLIRFAIAFWIEARAMRRLWREADRSENAMDYRISPK